MVVGGEQQVKARILQAVYNGVGAVEPGIAGIAVAVVRAAESGFQVGNGEVRRLGIGFDIAEDGIEIVAAVLLFAGVDNADVHKHIAGGEHRGCGEQLGGGLRRGFRVLRGGIALGGGRLLIRLRAAGGLEAQADDGDIRCRQ